MLSLKKSSHQGPKEWKVLGFLWKRLSCHVRQSLARLLLSTLPGTTITWTPPTGWPIAAWCLHMPPQWGSSLWFTCSKSKARAQLETPFTHSRPASAPLPSLVGLYIPQMLYIMGHSGMTSVCYHLCLWLPNIPHILSPFVSPPCPPCMPCFPPADLEHFQLTHPAPSPGHQGDTLCSPLFLPWDPSSGFREKKWNRRHWKEYSSSANTHHLTSL